MFSHFRVVLSQNFSKHISFSTLTNKHPNCAQKTKLTLGPSSSINKCKFNLARQIDLKFQRQLTLTASSSTNIKNTQDMENKSEKINVNKEELKKRLTPMQYQVTQEAATERPFTGCYNKHYEKGVYQCIVCHQDLFSSDTKYDSGCGWPAFNDVLDKGKVTLHRDASIPDRVRTEVRCSRCSAHMGHVFEDGPKPTRKRYCINSAAIEFIPADELNKRASAATATTKNPNSVLTATPIAQQ